MLVVVSAHDVHMDDDEDDDGVVGGGCVLQEHLLSELDDRVV
jgi:hypothetical protein